MSTDIYDMLEDGWISTCCGAPAYMGVHVEPDGKTATGICSQCKDGSGFTKEGEDE